MTNVKGTVANIWENGGKSRLIRELVVGVRTIGKVVNRNIRRVAKGLR